jgi:hypothetical protein
MKPLYVIKQEEAKLHISKGNSKIGKGIWSFATLPGNAEHLIYIGKKVLLTDIPGTCSKHCDGCAKDGACYAWRDAKLHHNVTVRAWGENTLLLRNEPDRLFAEIDEFITGKNSKYFKTGDERYHAVKTWRWNVSGEVENVDQLKRMNDLARKHPEVAFGIYTKNYEALEELIKAEEIAKNFVINVSEWHGVAAEFLARHPGEFNVFEYDDSNRDTTRQPVKAVHCPAVDKSGHHVKMPDGLNPITCDHCGRCYRKTGERTAVWAH